MDGGQCGLAALPWAAAPSRSWDGKLGLVDPECTWTLLAEVGRAPQGATCPTR